MDALHQLEVSIILLIQSLGTWLGNPMKAISFLGNEEFFMLVMPILYWCVETSLGVRMGMILLLSNGLNAVVKLAFHMPRPYWLDGHARAFSYEPSFGLPSGHAQNAASLWGLMALSIKRRWSIPAVLLVIFLIGFSRIYLGVHFISDVLTGWLLGGLLLFVFLKVEKVIGKWVRKLNLTQMIGLALLSSFLICGSILFTTAILGNWQPPQTWLDQAQIAAPGSEIDPVNLEGAFTIAGTWFGMLAGVAWLYHLKGGFQATGTFTQRALRYMVGSVGIIVFWSLLGHLLPDNADALSFGLRYLRYVIVGLWISAIAPMLFEQMGLTSQPELKLPPLSSSENPL